MEHTCPGAQLEHSILKDFFFFFTLVFKTLSCSTCYFLVFAHQNRKIAILFLFFLSYPGLGFNKTAPCAIFILLYSFYARQSPAPKPKNMFDFPSAGRRSSACRASASSQLPKSSELVAQRTSLKLRVTDLTAVGPKNVRGRVCVLHETWQLHDRRAAGETSPGKRKIRTYRCATF